MRSDIDTSVVAYLNIYATRCTEVEDIIVGILRGAFALSGWFLEELALLAVDVGINILFVFQSVSFGILHQVIVPKGVGGDDGKAVHEARLPTVIEEEVRVNAIIFPGCRNEIEVFVLHVVAKAVADSGTVATPIGIGGVLLGVLHGQLHRGKQLFDGRGLEFPAWLNHLEHLRQRQVFLVGVTRGVLCLYSLTCRHAGASKLLLNLRLAARHYQASHEGCKNGSSFHHRYLALNVG